MVVKLAAAVTVCPRTAALEDGLESLDEPAVDCLVIRHLNLVEGHPSGVIWLALCPALRVRLIRGVGALDVLALRPGGKRISAVVLPALHHMAGETARIDLGRRPCTMTLCERVIA